MFCRYCKTLLFEKKGPCPTCGAPYPLLELEPSYSWDTGNANNRGGRNGVPGWGDPSASAQWEQPLAPAQWGQPEQSSAAAQWGQPMQSFPSVPPAQSFMPFALPQAEAQQGGNQQQSLLPVPYQGNMGLQQNQYQSIPLQLVPDHALANLLPALPQQEEVIYVAPMYTKPRAIIPRYRILSGFLSFLIVMLALCGGVGYYAQTSGKIAAMSHFIVGKSPQNLQPTALPKIPDPPDQTDKDKGPAYAIIPSAATASKIDPKSNVVLIPQKVFRPGEQFFLTYSVTNPVKKGYVTIEWYMGNVLFSTQKSTDNNQPLIGAGDRKIGSTTQNYAQPTSGMVILYWTDDGGQPKMAQKLYFAVRN